jgi:hypothetical protein
MSNAGPPLRKPATHDAWAWRRLGRKPQHGYWLEIGLGRENGDGSFESFLDRTPIGGFDGHVVFRPRGSGQPPPPDLKPQRPGEKADDGGEDSDF